MARTRAWRRYKNYTKAKRKRDIDFYCYWWWFQKPSNNPLDFSSESGWYHNLHQYSKNKIHCSCPMCSTKTKNKGRHKKRYAPVINYRRMDKRRQMAMDDDYGEYLENN